MAEPRCLLTARAIVKSFGPTSVLKGFDLSIMPGEVHAFPGKLFSSYDDVFNAFKEIIRQFSADERAALFHDNAERVYRL